MRNLIALFTLFLLIFSSCKRSEYITFSELSYDKVFKDEGFSVVDGETLSYARKGDNALMKYKVKNGRFHGKCIGYYSNGDLEIEGFYNNGMMDGKWVKWLENGNKSFEIHYSSGKLNGEYITFHENGQLKEKGSFMNNIKSGIWKVYDSNGNLIEKVDYHALATSSL